MGGEFDDFLTFRDLVNSQPALLEEYNRMKHGSEGFHEDDYRDRKDALIERVLSNARKPAGGFG